MIITTQCLFTICKNVASTVPEGWRIIRDRIIHFWNFIHFLARPQKETPLACCSWRIQCSGKRQIIDSEHYLMNLLTHTKHWNASRYFTEAILSMKKREKGKKLSKRLFFSYFFCFANRKARTLYTCHFYD